MAILFVDGFDAGDAALKWSIDTGTASNVATRFNSGRSVYFGNSGSRSLTKYFTASSEVYIGFAGAGTYGGFNNIIILNVFTDAGLSAQLNVVGNANGSIAVRRGATTLATSPAGVLVGSWHYIELHAKIDPSAGVAELRVDGAVVATFSGNTKNTGTANTIDSIQFTNSGTLGGFYIDDVYILNTVGAAPYNTYLGDIRIYALAPDAAGSSTQMTPSAGANYTTVDELPYSAADYVRGSAGQTDLYSTANIAAGVGTIFGVQSNAVVKKTDAGNLSGRTVIKSGATTSNGTSVALTSSDVTLTDMYQVNPDTSAAWSESDINNLEIGVGGV